MGKIWGIGAAAGPKEEDSGWPISYIIVLPKTAAKKMKNAAGSVVGMLPQLLLHFQTPYPVT